MTQLFVDYDYSEAEARILAWYEQVKLRAAAGIYQNAWEWERSVMGHSTGRWAGRRSFPEIQRLSR